MIDRQQLESILLRRFPGAPLDQVAAATNAIMGLMRETNADTHCAGGCCSHEREDGSMVASSLPRKSA
jgi:hypothetical protein